jgi:hypothetical protein
MNDGVRNMRKGRNLTAAERDAALERGRTHARISFGEQRPIVEEDAAEHMTPFSLRLKGSLKQALEAAAQRRGHSLNGEINRRLEETCREEAAVGGPAMQEIVRLWVAAFLRGGGLGARAQDHPEWSIDRWLLDPFAYRAAVHAGTDALLAAQPQEYKDSADPAAVAEFERLLDFFAKAASRGATIRVGKKEQDQ